MCDTKRTRYYLPFLQQGSEAHQWNFYLEFFDCARTAAWSCFDDHERNDITADAFRKIFQRATEESENGDYKLPDLKGRYVHGAVRNESRLAWLKKQRKHVVPLTEEVSVAVSPTDDLDDVLDAAKLTEEEKEIVCLKVLDKKNWTWAEIAEEHGISASTIRRRFSNALDKLRRWYEDGQGTGEAGKP